MPLPPAPQRVQPQLTCSVVPLGPRPGKPVTRLLTTRPQGHVRLLCGRLAWAPPSVMHDPPEKRFYTQPAERRMDTGLQRHLPTRQWTEIRGSCCQVIFSCCQLQFKTRELKRALSMCSTPQTESLSARSRGFRIRLMRTHRSRGGRRARGDDSVFGW